MLSEMVAEAHNRRYQQGLFQGAAWRSKVGQGPIFRENQGPANNERWLFRSRYEHGQAAKGKCGADGTCTVNRPLLKTSSATQSAAGQMTGDVLTESIRLKGLLRDLPKLEDFCGGRDL